MNYIATALSLREQKFEAIRALALSLVAQGATMTFAELAAWLNEHGWRTGWGAPYSGGRGVARLVHAAYDYICTERGLGEAGAAPIAEAFTNQHGLFAYE